METQPPRSAIKRTQIITKTTDVNIAAMNTFILVSITCLAISSKDTQIDMMNKAMVPTKYITPAIALLSNTTPNSPLK